MRTANPAGCLEQVSGARVLHLRGGPYEMGLQQGTLLREQLHELVANYLYGDIILESPSLHLWLLTYARRLEQEMPSDLRSEMQGIADGAGLSYRDVVLLNTIPDLLALTSGLPSWEALPTFSPSTLQSAAVSQYIPSCAAFAVWGQATSAGELLVGHRLAYAEDSSLGRYLLVVVRQPTQGNSFVSLGLMGMVGVWAGMNEEKISAVLCSSPSVDLAPSGQLLPFVIRRVLERAGDLTEAVNTLIAANRLCGGNVILGDGKAPKATVVELSAHRQVIFEDTDEGLLARTDHFLDPELELMQQGVLLAQERFDSEMRLAKLQKLLKLNSAWIGVEKGLAFLGSEYGQSSADIGTDTVMPGARILQCVLFYPDKLALWVAQGDVLSTEHYANLGLASVLLGYQVRSPCTTTP